MGLFVSTAGSNVTINELGITLNHPTNNYDLGSQFDPEDLRNATSLTQAIVNGILIWKKTSAGVNEPSNNYDPDWVDLDNELTGGYYADRVLTMRQLVVPRVITTANVLTSLTDPFIQTVVLNGSTNGQVVRLFDATQVILGHRIEFVNISTVPITIQNNAGTPVLYMSPNSRSELGCYDNSVAAGTWLEIGHGQAGLTIDRVSSLPVSTNNSTTTWVNKLTSSTLNLATGSYRIRFTLQWSCTSASNTNSRGGEFRLMQNTTMITNWVTSTKSTIDNPIITGYWDLDGISGTNTFTIDFRNSSQGASTISVDKAFMAVERIS